MFTNQIILIIQSEQELYLLMCKPFVNGRFSLQIPLGHILPVLNFIIKRIALTSAVKWKTFKQFTEDTGLCLYILPLNSLRRLIKRIK